MEGGYERRVEEFRETEYFEAISGNVPIALPLVPVVYLALLFPPVLAYF